MDFYHQVSQLQSQMEQTKLRLQKEHSAEMERTLQQVWAYPYIVLKNRICLPMGKLHMT